MKTDCDGCVSGQYADQLATVVCVLCSKGRYSSTLEATVSSTCVDCILGKYSPLEGQTLIATCLDCPLGRYNDQVAAASLDDILLIHCNACPIGKYGDTLVADALIDCKDCSTGRYSDAVGKIKDYGLPGDTESCKACPQGRYNNVVGQGVLITGCVACSAGLYNDDTASTDASDCSDCPAGKFAAGTATKVNEGSFVLDGEVLRFVPGSSGTPEEESCRPCLRGKWSSTSGLSASNLCTDCASGKYSTEFGVTSISTCTTCPTGTIGVKGETGSKGPLDCKSCRYVQQTKSKEYLVDK